MTRKKNTSGGSAGIGGFDYQAAVSTIVSIHTARGTKLDWLKGIVNDTPTEWSPETGGAGDDIQVILQDNSIVEIQVKKGFHAGTLLWEALIKLAHAIHDRTIDYGLLIVCSNSSKTIREHLAKDIERLGDGRTDDLKNHAKTFVTKLETLKLPIEQICNRLRIVTVHALNHDSDAIKAAKAELEHICKDKSQRDIAWLTLYLDTEKRIEVRGRRTPSNIMRVLDSAGIQLKTDTKDSIAIVKKITQLTLESYTSFSIFGIGQPFELEKSWIPLEAIVQKENVKDDNKLEAVLDKYHSWEKRESSQDKYTSETIGRFIKLCVVVAGPGMGKSTLLKKLARIYSNDGFPTLFIRLPQLSERIKAGSSFEEGVFELGLANTGISFSDIQKSGIKEWTILLDGLDECGTYQNTICDELTSFVKGYPNTRVIITTRPIGYTSSILKKDWRHYELLPLEPNYAINHIDRLLSDIHPEESTEFETTHNFATTQLENKKISQIISRNPFLLGLATSLFLRKTDLGESKIGLYKNLFKLIDEDKSDRVSANTISQPTLIAFLNIIGWDVLINPIDDLDSIMDRCTEILNRELQEPKLKARQISQDCLAYWEQAGLLEQLHFEGTKTITFIHKTFGEYAAARYLVSLEKQEQVLFISSQLNNQASHEAITFTASLGAENTVFTEIIKNIKSQKDNWSLLVHALKLLKQCEYTPNEIVINQLFDIVFNHLKTVRRRFDINVAEAVLDICDLFPNEILQHSAKLLSHTQPWTKLSAWAFVLKTDKEKTYDFNNLLSIFKKTLLIDNTQPIRKKGFFLQGFGANSKLSEQLIVFTIEEILLRLPSKRADSIIKEVLDQSLMQTTNFYCSVSSVLTKYGRKDLAKPFQIKDIWTSLQKMQKQHKKAKKIANKKIFTCLDFNKHDTKLVAHPSEMLLHLSAFLSASHHNLDSTREWNYPFDMECVTEVFKGMLGVTEIDSVLFSNDIQIALNEIKQDSFNLYDRTIDIDIEPDWKKAKDLELDAEKLETALHHHSDWIVEIAAKLLENITNNNEQVTLAKRLLNTGNSTTLWAAAEFSKEVNRIDLVYKRLQKPINFGCWYLFRILQDEDLKLNSSLLKIIENGITYDDPETASEAAKLALKVAKPSKEKLYSILSVAYSHWKETDKPYPTGKNSTSTPTSPRKYILEAMFLISIPKPNIVFEYCLDERDDIRKIAKPVYLQQISKNDELKTSFLEEIVSEKIEYRFLYSAIGHHITFTSNQFEVIDRLVIHKNHRLRLATVGILDQKDLPKKQRQIWLSKFLEDEKLEILEKVEKLYDKYCS